MKNNSIRKAIRLCDEGYTFDKNELLVEIRERLREEYDALKKDFGTIPRTV